MNYSINPIGNLFDLTLKYFSEPSDINLFFSTIATTSTIFIIVTTTFIIYWISAINEINNKNSEIIDYEFELQNLKTENEKIEKNMVNFEPNSIEYRQYAEKAMINNARKYYIELRIKSHTKFINKYKNIKLYLNKSIKNLYTFLFLYMIIPLLLLSLPTNKNILVVLNIIKIILLITLTFYIYKIIKDCKDIILLDDI